MVPLAKVPFEEYFLQQLNSSDTGQSVVSAKRSLPKAYSVPSKINSNLEPYLVLSTSGFFDDDADVPTPTMQTPTQDIPVYIIAIVATVLFVIMTTFVYFLCRCLTRKKKRESQLASITPKPSDPRMAGVRANHPIEFVVPTTVVVSETTTEDSISESDYSSSGAKLMMPMVLERRRKRMSGFQINPDDLQHGLYVGVSAAAASEKSAFVGDLGRVGFSLKYNFQRSQLTVRIVGARDLPCHFLKTTAHPCAKLVLLPDRTTKYMTRVQRNTTSPAFNESFTFSVRRDQLPEKKLKISVWDYDRFSRKCLIGQVVYNVSDSGIMNTLSVEATSGEIWADLKQESMTTQHVSGEMLLSLSYNPDSATLTLGVLKIRKLSMEHDKGKEKSIYAKVSLYVRRKLVRTKKTPSRKKAPDVEFNNPFSIHVPPSALKEVDLMVVLCEKWPLGKKILGRTQAGTNCLCEQGLQHWQDMLSSPKSTCAQWHVLCA